MNHQKHRELEFINRSTANASAK